MLVGAGVSSIDIARDLGPVARSVYQSSRGGMYDIPSHLLFENSARIGAIQSFDPLSSSELDEDGSIRGTVTLQSGEKLCGIHHVILCTGYHVSFPFMRQYHADSVSPEDADNDVLVTNGQQTHNLHKDIWYIPGKLIDMEKSRGWGVSSKVSELEATQDSLCLFNYEICFKEAWETFVRFENAR